MEWHFETEESASLTLFGILENGEEVKYALKIPYALSILAHGDPNAEVIGLDQFPEDETPPLYIHYLFMTMVLIGMFATLLSVFYVMGSRLRSRFIFRRFFLWLIVALGPLSMIAIEAGWWLAEVGRQPWVLRGLLKTKEAATTSGQVDLMLYLFILLYLVLGFASAFVLIRMVKHNPVEQELLDRQKERR
ncbi:cytochrome d ubiquinol oxidase subunit I [Gracilibacillus boraciitolerans JCM 21714]|uniref:Cytochrome d ubiquinol oxidase subunit I n=1 Tax=Gracilibacillus boraciitolerans JCM 21714 TaxID=1298598 RepID=W4VJK5_9BACI|nr:cytochrome d ubiquinol oxidase subunit I [Gracilibacillus boraciitolerans JCM 21714]